MKKKFFIVTTVPISLMFFKGQIQVLKKKFEVELVSSPGKKFDNACAEEAVKGHALKMKREIAVLTDLFSLFKFIKLFIQSKPDIVHGSTPKAGLLSMLAGWFTRVSTRIYYIHGLRYEGATGFKRKLLIKMEKLSCFFATDIFAVSQGVKKILAEDMITNKKINIIGNGSVNGIDVDYFSPYNDVIPNLKLKYSVGTDAFVFGFIGRLVGDKGINELVQAFEYINSKYKESKLVLVGGFENKLDPLNEKIKSKILNHPNILYVGFQKDIRPYLKMMDVFVFPSYREGFGVSLMEAAAMGVPAISSDIIGCNEIIQDNYNGVLIPSKSLSHLEKAMEKCIRDIEYTKQLSSVSRQYVIDKYEQNELWDKTLKAYLRISD